MIKGEECFKWLKGLRTRRSIFFFFSRKQTRDALWYYGKGWKERLWFCFYEMMVLGKHYIMHSWMWIWGLSHGGNSRLGERERGMAAVGMLTWTSCSRVGFSIAAIEFKRNHLSCSDVNGWTFLTPTLVGSTSTLHLCFSRVASNSLLIFNLFKKKLLVTYLWNFVISTKIRLLFKKKQMRSCPNKWD